MKRALTAVAGTAVGLIGLLGYKSGSPPKQLAVGAGGPSGAGATRLPPTTLPPTTLPPTTTPQTTPSPTAPRAPSTGLANGTFTGSVVNTRYGPVQVQVTISGGQLSDVSALELPVDRARSAAISNAVAPILRREALAAKGANIDTVSGATYTSEGYARSLQAAIDAARQ
jgi:uncharacterized protein with FMN-binding domain